jgi:flagellar basal body-associated protein FliL
MSGSFQISNRRGITVLGLVVLIVVIVLAVVLLVRYLGHRQATTTSFEPPSIETQRVTASVA